MPAIQQDHDYPRSQVVLEFQIPENIAPSLRQIENVWNNLKLMRSDMPLTKDFDLWLLHEYADRILIIDVVEHPLWLRVDKAGPWVIDCYGQPLAGRYVENIDPRPPLDDLWVQCVAAIKDRRPVLYRHRSATSSYDRIVFPLWGDSRVEKLISAVSETPLEAGGVRSIERVP